MRKTKRTQHRKEYTVEWEPQTNRSVKTDEEKKNNNNNNQVVNYERLITTINSLPLITHPMHLHWNTIRRSCNFSTGIASFWMVFFLFPNKFDALSIGEENCTFGIFIKWRNVFCSIFRSVHNARCTDKQKHGCSSEKRYRSVSFSIQFNWIPHSLR